MVLTSLDTLGHLRSKSYVAGIVLSAWVTGVLVSLVGLLHAKGNTVWLSDLCRTKDTAYWYTKGVNWRAIPAWICAWTSTIDGLVVTVGGMSNPPRSLIKLYYMAFLIGFFVGGAVFYLLRLVFSYPRLGEYEKVGVYETFTPREAASLGVMPVGEPEVLDGVELRPGDDKMEHDTIVEKSV
ncbi:hypothetical protein E4T44_11646 [Aureobasidium sp. EXF-8845]|nr:hypothetical protein E4T45_11521 [Aureobasidium sp. EXF-8846]KAI4801258.1 hypothetical protein E4T44_11646 [Aureobasidium sp. EXF-8845]